MTSPISSSTEFHDPELRTNVGELVSHSANIDLAGAGTNGGAAQAPSATDTQVPMETGATQTTMQASETSAGAAVTGGFDPMRSDASAASPEESANTMEKVREALSQLPQNVGRTEQMIRLGAGTALIAGAVAAPVSKGWRIGMAALGAMQIATGSTRYCPVWHALGVNTNEAKKQESA